MSTHYQTLGLDERASQAEISLRYHDTEGRRTPDMERAFAILSDPVKREAYDRSRSEPPLPGSQATRPQGTGIKRALASAVTHPAVLGTVAVTLALVFMFGLIVRTGGTAHQLRNAGNEALEEGDLYTALIKHERAVSINGGDPGYLSDLARTYQALERHQDAIATYTQALKIDPKHPAGLLGRAKALEDAGREEAAQADIKAAKRLGIPLP